MKTMSEIMWKRKYLMFDQDDFDEVIKGIESENINIEGESFDFFIESFTRISELICIYDLSDQRSRAMFLMSVLNLFMGDSPDKEPNPDDIIDIVNALCVHMSISNSYVADMESYRKYIIDIAPAQLKGKLSE